MIKHKFTSAKADGADATLVQPSDWNDSHDAPPFCYPFLADASAAAWTNMPAAADNFRGVTHQKIPVDLTHATEARLVAYLDTVASAVGAKLFVEYSTIAAPTTWVATGIEVTLGSTANAFYRGAWTTIPAGALADVNLRLRGSGGDGGIDPNFGPILLQVR